MMNYDWNFSRLFPYVKAFITGTETTLLLTVLIIGIGTVIGIALGLVMKNRAARIFLYPFVDVIRALPPLVLLLFMYYLLTTQVIGTTVQAFWVCVIAFSLNLAAFTSDLVRAALGNVPRSSIDAGRALGMTDRQLTIHIVLPSVIREIVPAMTLLYIAMLKMTSLASIINVRDVVFTAETVIAYTTRSLEAWIVVGLIYITLVIPLTYFARRVERWTGRSDHWMTGV